MQCLRHVISCLLVFALIFPTGCAVTQTSATPAPAATTGTAMPEIQFKVLTEPLKIVPGDWAPSEWVDQKYVAVVNYKIPPAGASGAYSGPFGGRIELNWVLELQPSAPPFTEQQRETLQAAYGRSIISAVDSTTIEVLRLSSGSGWKPAGEIPFFPAGVVAPSGSAMKPMLEPGRLRARAQDFYVIAPSRERAQELAQLLVAALNLYPAPLRRTAEEKVRQSDEEISRLSEQIAVLKKAQEEAAAQLGKLQPMTDKVLEELRAKDVFLQVELAGVEGKLKAIKDRPAQDTAEVYKQAQIEQAGLLAQRDKITQTIKQGEEYVAAKKKAEDAAKVLGPAEYSKMTAERNRDSYRMQADTMLPAMCSQPVIIRPIEWGKAKSK